MVTLNEEDFIWEPYYPNDIESNGLDGYDCTIFNGTPSERKYSIRFQYKQDTDGLILNNKDVELYVLFECETFIHAYKTLEDAKTRAYNQYVHIFGYVASFIEQ